MSMDHERLPYSCRQDCLMTSVRYFVSNDCISYRMPEDDLAGSSCHFEKRFPDVFLTRADSWKTYATSSWRALKNFVSSRVSASSDRTHEALTKPASKCRSSRDSISSSNCLPSSFQ